MYLSWLPLPVQRCSLSFCVQSCSLVYFYHVFLCIRDLSTVSDCKMFFTVFFPCMGSFNASCVSISDWEILTPFCCLIILLWHIILCSSSLITWEVWYLPYRNGPFHHDSYCHVKPVSETSMSLEVLTKRCSTRATQVTAKLQMYMVKSEFLASNIEAAVYAMLLDTHDYWMKLERVSRGKGNPSEYIRQGF